MNWSFTPFAAPLLVGAVAMLVLIGWAWQKRGAPGAVALMFLSAALAFYAVGYAFELGSLSVADVRFWFKIQYLGIPFLPGLTVTLILDYLGYRRWLNPALLAALFFIPAITLALAWTNESHQLIWQGITIDRSVGFTLTSFERGVWYIVHNVFIYLELLVSMALTIRAFVRASGLFRRQLVVVLIAVALPMLVNVLYLTKAVFPGLDLNPYGQVIAAGLFGWGMFNYRLLDLSPVAQEAVVQSMADAVLVFDARHRLISANPAASSVFGSPIQSLGKTFADLFPTWPDILAAAQSNQARRDELPLRAQDAERVFNVSATPLSSQPRQAEGYVLVARDVTEQAGAQAALLRANQRLEMLRKFDADFSTKLSLKHIAAAATEAALRLSGAESALLTQHGPEGFHILQGLGGYASLKAGELLDGNLGIAARVARTREPELTLDALIDPDYVAINTATRAQITLPLLAGGRVLGVLALETSNAAKFNEETLEAMRALATRIAVAFDNALIYEERDRLVKELDSFAHTVAHDLKNPLGVIRGYAEMLGMVKDMPETGKMYAERIQKGAAQAFEMIEALLMLAGASALDEAKIGVVEVGDTVKSALGRLSLLMEQSGAQVEAPESWPVALGYSPWLEELWVNYVSNAVKYGGQPPRIRLGWNNQPDGKLRFWAQDNGRGLASDEISQLFRPFVRLDKQRADGHGLGLSIVQRIVNRLGGEVGVESATGKGSKFYFTLPPAKN